ncbi:MAG: hypothetical protein ACI8RZ_002602 [Myxococcota bacterium]|jgi:uncharacterized protein (TIGR00725 family)
MRPILSIIGSASTTPEQTAASEAVGRLAVEAGFRICCGGRGGVMVAACRGARSAANYREGDTIGILMDYDPASANEHVDIAIPTGIGFSRNTVVVASGQVVVAVAGGAGTLSEIALAWQLKRPVIALCVGGWSEKLAGQILDHRHDGAIHRAESPEDAVRIATGLLSS